MRSTTESKYPTSDGYRRKYEIAEADGRVVYKDEERFVNLLDLGPRIVEKIVDPDGEAIRSTWEYYTDPTQTGKYGQVKETREADGGWRNYEYDNHGRETVVRTGARDADPTNPGTNVRETRYNYNPADGDSEDWPNRPRTEEMYEDGVLVEKTVRKYHRNTNGETVEETRRLVDPANESDQEGDQINRRSYYAEDHAIEHLRGLPRFEEDTRGTTITHDYQRGWFIPNEERPGESHFVEDLTGTDMRTVRTHGTIEHPEGISGKTMIEVQIEDRFNRTLMSEDYLKGDDQNKRLDWHREQRDSVTCEQGSSIESDGTAHDTEYGCCDPVAETDEHGIRQTYTHDTLHRRTSSTKVGQDAPNIVTINTYDAVGRTLQVLASAGGLSTVQSNQYDLAGRILLSGQLGSDPTIYRYEQGGKAEVRIEPGNVTNRTVKYADGRTKYTERNGVIQSWTEYGVTSEGIRWTKSYSGPNGTNSPTWSKQYTDALGRTTRSERPGFGGSLIVQEQFYNAKGQLVRTTTTGQPDTLNEYNELGELVRTAVDVNGNGQIDLAGPDRISESSQFNETDIAGDVWKVNVSIAYAHDGSAAAITSGVQKVRLTGLGADAGALGVLTAESVSLDLLGNATVSKTFINRATKTTTQTTLYPDSTNEAINVTVNGLLLYSVDKTGVRTDYVYDALERQIAAVTISGGNGTPIRTVGQYTHYDNKGRVDWTEDATSNRTSYIYNNATGRRVATTDALNQTTQVEYDSEGRVIGTWGATYPVFYEFDTQGHMTGLYTLRDTNVVAESYAAFLAQKTFFDKTTWFYDETTGLLTNKVYADGKGTAYTYTEDGRLATRAWARGVVTTYRYDSFGAITNIDYSDATPDVYFAYDRLGRQISASAQGLSTNLFAYDPVTFAMTNETVWTLSGGVHSIARPQDTIGRPAGYNLVGPDLASAPSAAVAYGYDPLGRFSSITSVANSATTSVVYAYLPASHLLTSWTVTQGGAVASLTVSRVYEQNRDLLLAVSNLYNGNIVSGFDYMNDPVGRRVQRFDTRNAAPDTLITNALGYNLRSELTSATMGSNGFGYVYDPIGNRITGGTEASPSAYIANELNQYTQIVDGVTDVPTYDADGNMLTHGGWHYQWDGENRLIAASNSAVVLTFAYDHQSRRILKSVTDAVSSRTSTFVYDGWNLISEIIHLPSEIQTRTNAFVWGLDLSGTLQGAGGIGGLLFGNIHPLPLGEGEGSTVFPCFDANGNVTDLVGTDGAIAAHYEYDPSGNILVSSGDLAATNPYRFSSKYTDDESGLVYYGYRYYSPGLGRWLSRDPMEEEGGDNLYGFVGNDPVSRLDVLGLEWKWKSDGDKRADAICCNDTVAELAKKVHLDETEFLKWLKVKPGTGTTMPSSASQVIASGQFTVPNTILTTRGNTWDMPGSLSQWFALWGLWSEIDSLMGGDFYDDNKGYPGERGFSVAAINGFLNSEDIWGWLHFGHGGENWNLTGTPAFVGFRGTLVLKDEDFQYYSQRKGHGPGDFTAAHHKLGGVFFATCGAGVQGAQWKAKLVAPTGVLYAVPGSYAFSGGYAVWVSY